MERLNLILKMEKNVSTFLFNKSLTSFKMLKNPFTKNSVVKKYQNLISQINLLEDELKILTDSELRAKSFKLKKQYEMDQNLDSLIPESFA